MLLSLHAVPASEESEEGEETRSKTDPGFEASTHTPALKLRPSTVVIRAMAGGGEEGAGEVEEEEAAAVAAVEGDGEGGVAALFAAK